MSIIVVDKTNKNQPGRVFIEPVRKAGRQRNFGSLASVQGHMTICLGYTPDGHQAVYIPIRQAEMIRSRARRATNSPLYRLLKRITQHYENSAA